MEILCELKPLYANLKRLRIGEYLNTKEFELFAIESNLDKVWDDCKMEVTKKKVVFVAGWHDTEEDEEAFGYLMSLWYNQENDSFGNFIIAVLLNFANWNQVKLDFTDIHTNLKRLDIEKLKLVDFIKRAEIIKDLKPEKIKDEAIRGKKPKELHLENRKVFIVHGHDEKARIDLIRILKDDLKLEPVVLKEKPNVSIETIISKFERLAMDCSSAVILFTPDDEANGRSRARQNVILELGYFLGKFHDLENRRIVIIKTGDIEIPSDISGVLYLEFIKKIKEVFYDLQKQFESWGIIKE